MATHPLPHPVTIVARAGQGGLDKRAWRPVLRGLLGQDAQQLNRLVVSRPGECLETGYHDRGFA